MTIDFSITQRFKGRKGEKLDKHIITSRKNRKTH